MNQKTIRYFLIGGVALVWGLIIYRIAVAATGDDGINAASPLHTQPASLPVPDTFSLYANYPDPFIPDTNTTITTTMGTSAVTPSQSAASQLPAATKVDISFIQYHGMITNPSKKIKMALLSIHGKETMLREKESGMGVTIKKMSGSKLVLIYLDNTYTIYTQK